MAAVKGTCGGMDRGLRECRRPAELMQRMEEPGNTVQVLICEIISGECYVFTKGCLHFKKNSIIYVNSSLFIFNRLSALISEKIHDQFLDMRYSEIFSTLLFKTLLRILIKYRINGIIS